MEITFSTFLIVCPLVFLAGVVDSIGGGGGIISLPAYIFAGLPAHYAVATNKFGSTIGTMASTARYVKNGLVDWKTGIPGIIAALVGSEIGANLSLLSSDALLKGIMLPLLPVIAFIILKNRNFDDLGEREMGKVRRIATVTLISLVIGLYDGFYGPGTGTFLIIGYVIFAKMDPVISAGNAKLANLASNIMALLVFLRTGYVVMELGIAAAAFSIAGHYIGAGLAIKKGGKLIKTVIIAVIVLLFIKLISEYFA